MSLELTDEERALILAWEITPEVDVDSVDDFLTIIRKLQAGKRSAEFKLAHSNTDGQGKCVYCYFSPLEELGSGDVDPRHTWKDEQWMDAAQAELSREDKG